MSDLPPQGNTPSGKIDRQIRELCKAVGVNAEVALRIVLLVVDLLQDSITRTLGAIGVPPIATRPATPATPPPPPPITPPPPGTPPPRPPPPYLPQPPAEAPHRPLAPVEAPAPPALMRSLSQMSDFYPNLRLSEPSSSNYPLSSTFQTQI